MESKRTMNAGSGKLGIVFLTVIICVCILIMLFSLNRPAMPEISYSDFIKAVQSSTIQAVHIIDSQEIRGVLYGNQSQPQYFLTYIPYPDTSLIPLLESYNVIISGAVSKTSVWVLVFQFLPYMLFFVVIYSMYRQNRGMQMRSQQFVQSRMRRKDVDIKTVFADVAGQEEAKFDLAEVVDFLKNPKKFIKMGARIPRGILLVGSPGTGKTLLARAVAGEADVPFFHISGSDFVEMFVGVGASRVRDLFSRARREMPCIVFIDELDAVGRARGAGFGGGHDEREQTLNQMLVEMDGFDTKDGIIVLAATNRPDVLDPALLRPGRFDRQIMVMMPNVKEREAILTVHAKKVPLSDDIDINHFARATSGMSGADLANMVNEAALCAVRSGKNDVGFDDFEVARDKWLLGSERKSAVLSDKARRMIAYHEAGHALMYYYASNMIPLHKVTIIPHGRALGVTVGLPEEDVYCHSYSYLFDELTVVYGGYVAELVTYGEVTTGSQNDLQRASSLAHRMVCEWGMSDEMGAVFYAEDDAPLFFARELARKREFSEYTAAGIDKALVHILNEAKEKTLTVLTEQRDKLNIVANALLERETLSDTEIRALLGFEPSPSAPLYEVAEVYERENGN